MATWTKGNGPATKWRPGQSGNPKGRPKTSYVIADLAMELVPDALAAIAKALKDPDRALPAAVEILNRAFGKSPQAIFAHIGGELAVTGGIDRTPERQETPEEWLERRRAELAALEGPPRH